MKRIWTPPVGREVDMAMPFDVAYTAQQAIFEEPDREAKIELAREAKCRLNLVLSALEGMDVNIITERAVLPDPNDPEKMIMPTRAVNVIGSYDGIAFLNLEGWNREVELGVAIATTAMWPADQPERMDYTTYPAYPLISGTLVIRY